MSNPDNPLSVLAKMYEDKSRRDGAENEYLIQENARLRKALIDYDEWGYFTDHDSGIGIVVNHFRDGGEPLLNVYVVPKDKVANNDWHSDMEPIGEE